MKKLTLVAVAGALTFASCGEKKSICDCLSLPSELMADAILNDLSKKDIEARVKACEWMQDIPQDSIINEVNRNCPELMSLLKKDFKKDFCECIKEAMASGDPDKVPAGCEYIEKMSEEEAGKKAMECMGDLMKMGLEEMGAAFENMDLSGDEEIIEEVVVEEESSEDAE
jgi:hypothetical protein